MTKAQAVRFIEEWSPLLAPEWDLGVVEGPAPDLAASEHTAAITKAAGGQYLRATIALHEVLSPDTDDSAAKHTLLHELLHLTLTDLEHAATEPLNALSYDAGRLARENVDRYIERTVDRLASAFESVSD